MEYTIEEIYDIVCDIDKILTVQFKVVGDGDGHYRQLIDSDYYDWCHEHFVNDGGTSSTIGYDEEEWDYNENYFNVDMWSTNYSNEDHITEYLYETYNDIKSLPSPKNEN